MKLRYRKVNYYLLVLILILFGLLFLATKVKQSSKSNETENISDFSGLENEIIPEKGIIIPLKIGGIGEKLLKEGVFDQEKLNKLYSKRSLAFKEEMNRLLDGRQPYLIINNKNSDSLLNFFWAFGLGNKNRILEEGPMVTQGKASNFASTAGWTLSKETAMDHYSKHPFIKLSDNQQALIEQISKKIYRPCCGNSTYFPDCNHGIAMLGYLELAVSQNMSEKEIYDGALALNSFWFPQDYLTIAEYLKESGSYWEKTPAMEILEKNYSSNKGIQDVASKVKNKPIIKQNGACRV